jgi:hypothetical protein
MAQSEWNVLPHEELQKPTENLWWVRGTLRGLSMRRVMTIARMADGRLLLHSPIALDEASMDAIESFGEPAFLIVPNGYHRLDAPAYKARYPELEVFAPSGSRSKVEEVIPVDGVYEEFPGDGRVELEALDGVAHVEGVLVVRSLDGLTLVFNDAIFNMDRKRDPLGFLVTTLFGSAPGPRVSRLAKWTFIKNQPAFRAQLLRYATLPDLQRVIVSHEKVAEGVAAQVALYKAAECVEA